jgi:hypothetical protein
VAVGGIGTDDESMPNAVDLHAAERQNKRIILPGFEGNATLLLQYSV